MSYQNAAIKEFFYKLGSSYRAMLYAELGYLTISCPSVGNVEVR